MSVVAKRNVMSLFSDSGVYSNMVRMVLGEKGVNFETQFIDTNNPPEDLVDINPYATAPTLIDRELVLFEANIIMEYLDERFPHPPLLPVYPVARAEFRKMMYRIEFDWYGLMRKIIDTDLSSKARDEARKYLAESLTAIAPVFADKTYFLNEEFSLLDCYLAPLLWRLPSLGVELPKAAKAVSDYAERVFARDAFQSSLTDLERELREAA